MTKYEEQVPAQGAYELEEDHTLKTMLGGDAGIKKIFSSTNIAKAQKVIDDTREEFFTASLASLSQLRETIYAQLPAGGAMGQPQLDQVHRHVFSLRIQADTLSFPFISSICTYVESVCTAPKNTNLNYTQLIRDMLDVLRLALQHKLLDANSPIAQAVMQSLSAVVERIKA